MDNLLHHNLIFGENWQDHFDSIFKTFTWPDNPSLYICNPSKTDPSVAPKNHENLFVLVPIAPGLHEDEMFKKQYSEKIIDYIEKRTEVRIKERIMYQKIFSVTDFESRYHSFKGTALGLSHTFFQGTTPTDDP